jgi:hypothetical protein
MNETTLKIVFEESLSQSSIDLIQRILKESLDYNTKITEIIGEGE